MNPADGEALWRPRPWCAGILSFLAAGLGQVYNGRPVRAACTFVGAHLLVLTLIALMERATRGPVLFAMSAGVALVALVTWDSVRIARRTEPHRRKVMQRWTVLIPLWVVARLLPIQPSLTDIRRHANSFRIVTPAMSPTLLAGDYVFAAMGPVGVVRRGDLVLYRFDREIFVKRAIGLPGDTVSMRAFRVTVNGRALPEPYVHVDSVVEEGDPGFGWQKAYLLAAADADDYHPTDATWGPLVVPPHQYLFLSDFRDKSEDSRNYGFIDARQLVGRPTWIYFSRDPDSRKIRWTRMGTVLH